MANGSTLDPQGDPGQAQSYDPSMMMGGGYGFNPMMMMGGYGVPGIPGMGALGGDPLLATLQPQAQYAQALLQRGTEASPVTSPWQAVARAVQGTLGGAGLARYGQQATNILGLEMGQASAMQQAFAARVRELMQEQTGGGPTVTPGAAPAPPTGPDGAVTPVTRVPTQDRALAVTPPGPLAQLIADGAAANNIPLKVANGLFAHESSFNSAANSIDPKTGRAAYGPIGLGQVEVSTAMKPGGNMTPLADNQDDARSLLLDPKTNINFSLQYLNARGQQIYGDKWNPNDPEMMHTALKNYGGYYNPADGTYKPGADLYANAVFTKGGTELPRSVVAAAAADPTHPVNAAIAADPNHPTNIAANPNLNLPAGWRAAQEMRMMALQAVASGNPYLRAMAPTMMQTAASIAQVGQFKNIIGPNGQPMTIDQVTGKMAAAGGLPSYDQMSANVLKDLGARWQANPNSLTPQERIQLQSAIQNQFKPVLDQQTGITRWAPGTPDWIKQYVTGAPSGVVPTTTTGPGVTAPGVTPEAIKQVGEESAGAVNEAAKDLTAAYASPNTDLLARVAGIRSELPRIASGFGTEKFMLPIAQIAARLGISDDAVRSTLGLSASDTEIQAKQLFDLVAQRVKDQGGVRAVALFNAFRQALPSLENRPESIDTLTHLLEATVRFDQKYAQDKYTTLNNQRRAFLNTGDQSQWKGIGTFNMDWMKQNDPKYWTGAALAASNMPHETWTSQLGGQPGEQKALDIARQYWSGTRVHLGPNYKRSNGDDTRALAPMPETTQ